MAAPPSIRVEGLDRYVRDLKKLAPEAVAEIKDVNRDLAGQVASVARTKAPRREDKLAGNIRTGATARSGTVKVGKKLLPYAGPVHFGWPARNIAPNPFMWDALDDRRAEIERQHIERVTAIAARVMA